MSLLNAHDGCLGSFRLWKFLKNSWMYKKILWFHIYFGIHSFANPMTCFPSSAPLYYGLYKQTVHLKTIYISYNTWITICSWGAYGIRGSGKFDYFIEDISCFPLSSQVLLLKTALASSPKKETTIYLFCDCPKLDLKIIKIIFIYLFLWRAN